MAYENLNLKYPNFCLGPVEGTLCTIDMSSTTTVLRIKTEAGGFIKDYTLSSNIVDELLALEYVGPVHLTSMMDKLTFFTLEKISSSICIIKRWEVGLNTATLDLKQQFVKRDMGNYYYDATGMAVEHYRRKFSQHNAGGIDYLEVDSTNNITSGDKLFLGPSSDFDNLGAGEYVTVNYVSGDKVYLNSLLKYQYVKDDQICFYNYVYLFSNIATGGDTTRGSVFKIDMYTGRIKEVNLEGMYKEITGSRWCSTASTVAVICGANILFVRPYVSYSVEQSIFLNNVTADGVDIFPVYDVVFDSSVAYKLSQKSTWRDDDGNRMTQTWQDYNWQKATLAPHVNTVELYTSHSRMIGQYDTTDINIKVTDQFGVGLRDIYVILSVESGDNAAEFLPDPYVTTDINGEAVVEYKSGHDYSGLTLIKVHIPSGGSTFTGSAHVWNSMYIPSDVSYPDDPDGDPLYISLFQDKERSSYSRLRQIDSEFEISFLTFGKTFFTTPGGDWNNPSSNAPSVAGYLPTLIVGDEFEGPAMAFATHSPLPTLIPMPNRITQVLGFESERMVQQLDIFRSTWYLTGYDMWGDPIYEWHEPYISMHQKVEEGQLKLDQLKLSQHTHWVDGAAYDSLWTYVKMDQFVFVELAVPVFWSVKNPINTNIWIRLRPTNRAGYASGLDINTLKFLVREVSYAGDTGYVDVTSQVVPTAFDIGPGLTGYELFYNPAQDFHHAALVFVHIEMQDTYEEGGVPAPNQIYVDYWFLVIPDYKFPYLENLDPDREQDNVPVDNGIYFEIKDQGAGVDIDSLELFVNSRYVTPTSIVEVNSNHYKITYMPDENFYYDKEITVAVKVDDSSAAVNTLWDSYRFYTVESSDIVFTDFDPNLCKRGISKFSDVSFLALGWGGGIDGDTIRVQVYQRDVTDISRILPVVYRVS